MEFRRWCIVLVTLVLSQTCCGDVCVSKGPCKCIFSNGTGIDLTPSIQLANEHYEAKFYKNQTNTYKLMTYYYYPCMDVLPKTVMKTSTCNKPLSMYREVTTLTFVNNTYSDSGSCDAIGETKDTIFSTDGSSLIIFNQPANTTLLLICAETKGQLQPYVMDDELDMTLAFYSRDACLKQIEDVGRSFGSTLLIIFFSLVIFYLTLGVLTRKFLMGATGLEVIPNLGFWLDLPNLVKDGWAYARNGFKLPERGVGPTTSPDPNSYDSI